MTDLRTAARNAYIYALPLIEIATTRQRVMGLGQTMGAFTHIRHLANHKHRAVTTPNNDTLYSTAQIDLSAGPVTITLPATGDRYYSLALMDAYTNNFAILGTRTTGPDGGTFRLVGPGEAVVGWNVIRSPTNHVWALARILVDGPHDLEVAREVQAGLFMQGPPTSLPGTYPSRSADWRELLTGAEALIAANPPPVTDRALLRTLEPLGLPDDFKADRFTPADVAEIEAGLTDGRAASRKGGLGGADYISGWTYPSARLGDFDQDYNYRAAVALSGLAALPPAEAMYMRAQAPDGHGLFDGTRGWRLHFPAGKGLPVHSFWSLSLYEATDDGQFFFTDNVLDRYAIGDRTPGLVTNADGSLDIWMGYDDPGPERRSNWLPAPQGPFALFMRAYLPKPELLDGQYRLPPVQPA